MKSSQAYIPTAELIANNKRRKLCIAISAGIVAVTIIIFVTVLVTTTITSKSSQSNGRKSVNSHYDDVVNFLFANKVSSLPAIVSGSPEHYAALFLADGDAYPAPEDGRKYIERYVLALLYYGTNGNDWKNHYHFLSGRDHCEWTETVTTPAGTFVKGVECNDDGYVIGLDLSNNNLVGRHIPFEIIHLTELEKLHLHRNDL